MEQVAVNYAIIKMKKENCGNNSLYSNRRTL